MPNSPFGPVVEKSGASPFISKTPKEILEAKEVYDVPIIYGTNRNEGCDPVAGFLLTLFKF
jgi:carboxylesterase type B